MMRSAVLLLFLVLHLSTTGQGTFSLLVDSIASLTAYQQSAALEDFIAKNEGTPVVEGDTVIFLAESPLGPVPQIAGCMNYFLHPRYADENGGKMQKIGQSDWFYLKLGVNDDARLMYQIKIGDQFFNDPYNPLTGTRFDMQNSVLQMPEYRPIDTFDEICNEEGSFIEMSVPSAILDHARSIQVYLPYAYRLSENRLPTVYFHDGDAYVKMGQVHRILDHLIMDGSIPPLIAIFDTPVNRGKEYRGDTSYLNYLERELVPLIDSTFRTRVDKASRGIVGGSRGGLSALYASHVTPLFGFCGAFAPAVHPQPVNELINQLAAADHSPESMYILGAKYDVVWYKNAVALKNHFATSDIELEYEENSQGHYIQAWVPHLGSMLQTFLPDAHPSRSGR